MSPPPAEVLYPPRLVARRREVRLQRVARIRRIAIVLLTLVTLAYGGWAIAHSRLFALDGIEIKGASRVSRQEILAAGRLRIGMNLLSIDPRAIRIRLEELPAIDGARIERLYPSRLRIVIDERTPAGVVVLAQTMWLFDARGVAIAETASVPRGLPEIRVSGEATILAGQQLPEIGALDALAVWHSLPGSMKPKAGPIEMTAPDRFVMRIGDTRVILGAAEDLSMKFTALGQILAKASGRRVYRVDVSAPARPAAVIA